MSQSKIYIIVGKACVGVMVFLQGRYGGGEGRSMKQWRSSVLGPTTSEMVAMADLSRRCIGCPKQMLIWSFYRTKIS